MYGFQANIFHFNNNQFKWFIYTCIFILNVVKMVMILFLVLMSYRSSFTAKLFYNPSISHSRPFCKIILVYDLWSITFYIMCSCTSSSSYPPSCETNRVPVLVHCILVLRIFNSLVLFSRIVVRILFLWCEVRSRNDCYPYNFIYFT